jgi:hypothetical protein
MVAPCPRRGHIDPVGVVKSKDDHRREDVTLTERDLLARQFERQRAHLRAVALRMLGSAHQADDTVQEAWLRLSRTDTSTVDNLGGWLTTVVVRICLDLTGLRAARLLRGPLHRDRSHRGRPSCTRRSAASTRSPKSSPMGRAPRGSASSTVWPEQACRIAGRPIAVFVFTVRDHGVVGIAVASAAVLLSARSTPTKLPAYSWSYSAPAGVNRTVDESRCRPRRPGGEWWWSYTPKRGSAEELG